MKINKSDKCLIFYIILLILGSLIVSYFILDLNTTINNHEAANQPYGRVFIAFLIGFLSIIVLLIYRWTIIYFLIPLNKLKKSANQLGIDINSTIKLGTGPKIFKETEFALTTMQNKLQNMISNRSRLLASIAHDLRTPITRAKLKVYFLENADYAARIADDLEEMEQMINATLDFSKNDFLKEPKKKINITELLATICDNYVDANKKVSFKNYAGNIPYMSAKYSLTRCFNNIIDNALKYAGEIYITVRNQFNSLVFDFIDNGKGIPEDKINQVLQPFYRIRDNNETAQGIGLGLTIVNETVQQHNGQLKISNRPEGGLLVQIILPLRK